MAALASLNAERGARPSSKGAASRPEVTSSQKVLSRSTRRSGGLPAISAALIAPIEMPATQSTP